MATQPFLPSMKQTRMRYKNDQRFNKQINFERWAFDPIKNIETEKNFVTKKKRFRKSDKLKDPMTFTMELTATVSMLVILTETYIVWQWITGHSLWAFKRLCRCRLSRTNSSVDQKPWCGLWIRVRGLGSRRLSSWTIGLITRIKVP